MLELVFNNGRIATALYDKNLVLGGKWSHLEQIHLPAGRNWNLSARKTSGKIHLRQNSPLNEILSSNIRLETRLEVAGFVVRPGGGEYWYTYRYVPEFQATFLYSLNTLFPNPRNLESWKLNCFYFKKQHCTYSVKFFQKEIKNNVI